MRPSPRSQEADATDRRSRRVPGARPRVLLIVLAAVLSAAAPARGQQGAGPALSIRQFDAEVELLIGRLDAAETRDARVALIATLPPVWRIADGGQEFQFGTAWATAMLQPAVANASTWSAARAALRRRLLAIREEVAGFPGTRPHQPHARTVLSGILSREEFQRSATSRWREDLQRWVGEWIENLLAKLGAGPGAGRRAGIVLAWIASLGALAALGWWIVRTIARRRPDVSLGLGDSRSRNVRARELALRSLAAARAGDLREAVRIAYRAALVRFEEQGVWRVDDARTPREYLSLLRSNDDRRAPMTALARRFEQVWYGNLPAAADEAAHVRAHLEELGCLRPGEQAT